MRVLFGVDGSPGSLASIRFVGRLLAVDKDELIFYYSPPSVRIGAEDDTSGTAGALQLFLATSIFDKSRECLPKSLREKVQILVGKQEARQGLLVAADNRRADLIVLGAGGVGSVKKPSLGSIIRHVVHHATLPVLVVRNAADSVVHPLRVLLASDGSEVSRHASEVLQRFSWPVETIGQAITVLEPAQSQVPVWLAEQLDDQQLAALEMGRFTRTEQDEARLRREATQWYGVLPTIFQGQEPLVVVGHAGEQILRTIDANRIDLVAVGARRQSAIHRAFLGSTSEHVLTQSPCAVLIVRGQQQE